MMGFRHTLKIILLWDTECFKLKEFEKMAEAWISLWPPSTPRLSSPKQVTKPLCERCSPYTLPSLNPEHRGILIFKNKGMLAKKNPKKQTLLFSPFYHNNLIFFHNCALLIKPTIKIHRCASLGFHFLIKSPTSHKTSIK